MSAWIEGVEHDEIQPGIWHPRAVAPTVIAHTVDPSNAPSVRQPEPRSTSIIISAGRASVQQATPSGSRVSIQPKGGSTA